jgi:hypothetical protein
MQEFYANFREDHLIKLVTFEKEQSVVNIYWLPCTSNKKQDGVHRITIKLTYIEILKGEF